MIGKILLKKSTFPITFTSLLFITLPLCNFNLSACGFVHEWPTEDTLRYYGLSEVQIERIKISLDTLLKIKDSLSKEKDWHYTTLTKLIDADEGQIKVKQSVDRLGELWVEILRNDTEFLIKMRKILPPKLYKRIKRLFKIGDPHKWQKELKRR